MRFTKKRITTISKTVFVLFWLTLLTTFISPYKRFRVTPTADTTSIRIAPDHALEELPLNDERPPAKIHAFRPADPIHTGRTTPDELIAFARTMIGTPYLYASTDPAKGFDCSGFITYVFNHFGIAVPRSSVDFTTVGEEVTVINANPGDLILFTGTDSTIRVVGHMGIVTSNNEGELEFIHSTSGKLKGVVITPFENYYKSRFVKVIRVFS